jgi:hypothetical protein
MQQATMSRVRACLVCVSGVAVCSCARVLACLTACVFGPVSASADVHSAYGPGPRLFRCRYKPSGINSKGAVGKPPGGGSDVLHTFIYRRGGGVATCFICYLLCFHFLLGFSYRLFGAYSAFRSK